MTQKSDRATLRQDIFAEHVYLVNYKSYLDNFHYVNKSLWNEKQYHFFVELNKTKYFHRLKYRIGGQIV